MPETVAVIAAIVSIIGALVTWVQIPRPDFQLLPIYVDDTHWHGPKDAVTATVGIQNQGSGSARRVALELNQGKEWIRTGASEIWPIVTPGQSVQVVRAGLFLDEKKREATKYSKGVGGLADFEGLQIRIQWRNGLGIKRTRTFDVDKEHAKVGRATRLDESLTAVPSFGPMPVTSAEPLLAPVEEAWEAVLEGAPGHYRLFNRYGNTVALRALTATADVDVSLRVDFEMPMGLAPNVGLPIFIEQPAGTTAIIRLQIDWTPNLGEPTTTTLHIS